ncbi:MAG: chromosome segregation protein, partial [Chloroflexota bacterium]|nr:chromosome segregation protein [Chloroflexota bacterium]
MFLKELHLAGFKSFAQPIHLEMAPGITAIVGPNGSGKSNVVDAVRWVLGEQSARALRGARSEDVIFAGSAARHALGMAEVTLVLDNSDGRVALDLAEVAIARRLHRSGETEYLLNRRRARLRDVLDVAGQAGLGPDSYCVVGQGAIEQLAMQRPQERRALIADAADIRRHESRLAQIESDLLQVQQNALRMSAVVAEIRPQLERLRTQAERADRHRRLRDELEAVARSWFGRALPRARAEMTAAETRRVHLQAAIAEARNVVAEAEQRRSAQQVQLHELRSRAAELDRTLGPERSTAERLHVEHAALEERAQALGTRRATLLDEEATLADQLQVARAALDASRAAHDEVARAAPVESDEQLEAAYVASEARIATLRRQVGEQRQLAEGAAREADVLEREVIRRQAALEAAAAMATDLARRRQEAEVRIDELTETIARLTAEETEALERQRSAERELAEVRPALDAARLAVRRAEDAQRAARQSLDALRGEERAFLAMESAIRDPAERQHLIARLPAPLRYQRAVAAALGEAARFHVLDAAGTAWAYASERTAERVIVPAQRPHVLDAERFGAWVRAVLDADASYQLAVDVLDEAADQGLAARYLADVIVVTTLAEARLVAERLARDPAGMAFRVASEDGHCLASNGEHALRPEEREAQAIDLRARRELLVSQLAEAQAQLERANAEVHDARAGEDAARQRQGAADEARRGASVALQRSRDIAQGTRRQLQGEQGQLQRLGAPAAATVADVPGELLVRLEAARNRRTAAEDHLRACEHELSGLLEERQGLAERRGRQAAELAARAEHAARLADTLRRDEADVRRLEVQSQALVQERVAAEDEAGTLAARTASLAATLRGVAERLTALQDEHAVVASKLEVAEQETEDTVTELEAQQARLADLRTAEAGLGAELEHARGLAERLEVELSAVAEALACDPSELLRTDPLALSTDTDDASLQRRLVRAQRELRSVGGVDYGVLVEYETLNDRYQNLTTQLDDLAQTETVIRGGMAEVRERMVEQFTAAFEDVSSRFKEMFRLLFGGGDAELLLAGEPDSAQCGIEIVAQPPGKRLNRLTTLSGGERSLVGGALLLALIGANPSPFCMLDEVDAALDEANVQRFAATLREMATQTQFIVVTHNRATMEMADALYGVTMTPGAVSQV